MTILYSAAEQESLVRANTNSGEQTTVNTFDSAFARCSIRTGSGSANTDYDETPVFTSATTIWIHFERYQAASMPINTTMLELYNSSGTAVFRLFNTAANTVQAQYWNGSAWTNIGSTFSPTTGTRYVHDLKIICGASGSYELYSSGALISGMSGSASMTAVTNIAKARFYNANPGSTAGNSPHFSQIIVSDASTIAWKQESKPPTSDGTDTGGTGTFAEIDETVLDDADVLQLASVADRHNFKSAARTGATGLSVKGVTVTARAKCGATGPTSIKFYLKIGGTRYYSPSIALTTSLAPYQYCWETNPATGAAWLSTAAQDANLEWGYEAA